MGIHALLAADHHELDARFREVQGALDDGALAAHPTDPAPARLALAEVLPRLAAHNALEESQIHPKANALAGPARGALLRMVRQELASLPRRYRD